MGKAVRQVLDAIGVEQAVAQPVWVAEGVGGFVGRIAADTLGVDGQPAARAGQNVVVVKVAVQRDR